MGWVEMMRVLNRKLSVLGVVGTLLTMGLVLGASPTVSAHREDQLFGASCGAGDEIYVNGTGPVGANFTATCGDAMAWCFIIKLGETCEDEASVGSAGDLDCDSSVNGTILHCHVNGGEGGEEGRNDMYVMAPCD